MKDKELQDLWKLAEQQLNEAKLLNNQSWVLQHQLFIERQERKAKKEFVSLILFKLLAIILGIVFIWFIVYFFYHFWERPAVVICTGGIILITGIVVVDYIIQLYLLCTFNLQGDILKSQKQLVYLETSIIRSIRISFLQLPFYTFFYFNEEVVRGANLRFWTLQLLITGAIIFLSLFLYFTISRKNLHKKWVRKLIDDAGGKSVSKAMGFMNEINDFEKDLVTTN
jgi:hypothetical protein